MTEAVAVENAGAADARVRLHESWRERIGAEFDKPYMASLRQFLQQQKAQGQVIYPRGAHYFRALDLTPFEQVRVVILGQDPYHGPGQAEGLCFSVPEGVPFPPSLLNIFKELNVDLACPMPRSGSLVKWAGQGVLLLNSVLTVAQGQAAAHQGKGWETFTDAVIRALNDEREGLVFMLWGSYAHRKGEFIDTSKHCVLKSVHPSPLSAHRGFLGCRHFSQANNWLVQQGMQPIDWCLG